MTKPLLISREGVIHQRHDDATAPTWIDGSIDTIASLSRLGFTIILVTFQPGVARIEGALEDMETLHNTIIDRIENRGGQVAGVFYCPHDEQDRCYCRPPQTGLLDVIATELDCDLRDALYFCDNDIEAATAQAVGCHTFICSQDNKLSDIVQRIHC